MPDYTLDYQLEGGYTLRDALICTERLIVGQFVRARWAVPYGPVGAVRFCEAVCVVQSLTAGQSVVLEVVRKPDRGGSAAGGVGHTVLGRMYYGDNWDGWSCILPCWPSAAVMS